MAKVVLSSNTSWYLYNYRRNTIAAFQAAGHEVICLAPRDAYSDRLESELGAAFIELEMDNQGNSPLQDLLLLFRFFAVYWRLKPIAVFNFTVKNNIYGTFATALLRIPAINNISGLGTAFIHPGWVGRVVRVLYRLSQPLAWRVFCQNVEDYKLLTSNKLVAARKLVLLPGSGVDLNRFRPVLESAREDRFRFLYLGRMLADKGLFELIEAFAQVRPERDCDLWLAGFSDAKNNSAISEAELAAWAQNPGICWLGPTDAPEELISQVDCVVLPSYREGLPRTLLEANAMEVPVIATDVPGCRSVVSDGDNGLLCTPRSVESLRLAMLAMLSLSPQQRQEMGRAGRDRVIRDYDEQLVIRRYVGVLTELGG